LIPGERPNRRIWTFATLVALLLHLGAAWVARALRVLDPSSLAPQEPELIQVVFSRERPKMFTELPEDRADEPPEDSDLLSNVDSRARDRAPGGSPDDMPRLEGSSEAPHVRMDSGEPEPEPATPEPETTPEPTSLPRTSLLGTISERITRSQARSSPKPPGISDIFQEEMSHKKGNAVLSGDISLSTTEWEFAPWVKSFRRAVLRRWRAPSAYYMGLIDGWTEIELEVLRDGTVRRIDVVGEDVGHRSLTTAAVFALEGAAPYRSLPSHFPDESLIVQIRFAYPRLKP
jgi:hypothetical protein